MVRSTMCVQRATFGAVIMANIYKHTYMSFKHSLLSQFWFLFKLLILYLQKQSELKIAKFVYAIIAVSRYMISQSWTEKGYLIIGLNLGWR